MKIPLNWLKEYVDVPSDVDELTHKLTAIGHMQDKKPEKVGDDVVIDLEVRQNRPDCLSVVGVAREVAAVTNKVLQVPRGTTTVIPAKAGMTVNKTWIPDQVGDDVLKIQNTAPELCKRFKAMQIKLGTRNAEHGTPQWMTERLTAYGIKSISPIVDITNYVTIELGESMHAFDVRHIEDGEIIIRKALDGEKLTILGGKVLTLTTDDLVIASKSKALSLAGMIGGSESGVQSDTTKIVLEAATYNQASIRRSSIRHSVRTEASTRHEKFLHPQLAEVALERAANLIVDICGGEIVAHADSYPNPVKELTIDLRLSEIKRLGGVTVSLKEAEKYLTSLGFEILSTQHLALSTRVPYWRTDIEQEADLVEEVLRLYGYENIPASLPPLPSPKNITSYWFKLEEQIRDVLLQLGFDEQITEPLAKASTEYKVQSTKGNQVILQNALNADKNALRMDLLEGLRHALSHQLKFGRVEIKLFELGKVYGETGDKKNPYFESRELGFIMHDASAQKEAIYLNSKGVVETLCKRLGFSFSDEIYSIQLLDETTTFCTIDIEKYWGPDAKKQTPNKLLYSGIPNFQKFDISVYLDDSVKVGEVISSLSQNYPSIENIDYVISASNKEGKKNVLLKFLTSKGDKDSLISKVTQQLQDNFGAEIR